MITCQIMGGLGNQLFQIFTTMAYAFEQKQDFGFLYTSFSIGMTMRTTYWNTLLANLKKSTHTNLTKEQRVLKEKGFGYTSLPSLLPQINTNTNYSNNDSSLTLLYGYFQSHQYFEKYWKPIYEMVGFDLFKEKIREKAEEHYGLIDFQNTISMHFRIGDYKQLPGHYEILPYEYYEKSLRFILNKIKKREKKSKNLEKTRKQAKTVFYFCEEKDKDEVLKIIDKLKQVFPLIEFIRVDNNVWEDWEQMMFMSCCKFNIIANSTFSWWGAFLNTIENRVVCYPSVWFGPKNAHMNTRDLFHHLPWEKIEEVENVKIIK